MGIRTQETCLKCNCTFGATKGEKICPRPGCQTWIQQFVEPLELYQPTFMETLWFKRYALACGGCGRDWYEFRWLPVNERRPLVCPYCLAKNLPSLETLVGW